MDIKTIEENFKNLNGLRSLNRKKLITELSLNLYNYLKNFGYKSIEKTFLKSFIPDEYSIRVKQIILKEILTELTTRNKIKPIEKLKHSTRLYKTDVLKSNDYESYKVLMYKNGFKSYCYKFVYDKIDKKPIKKLIGIYGINQIPENVLKNTDLIQNKSSKNKKFIGCYCVNKKSVSRSKTAYKIKAFELI